MRELPSDYVPKAGDVLYYEAVIERPSYTKIFDSITISKIKDEIRRRCLENYGLDVVIQNFSTSSISSNRDRIGMYLYFRSPRIVGLIPIAIGIAELIWISIVAIIVISISLVTAKVFDTIPQSDTFFYLLAGSLFIFALSTIIKEVKA